MAKSVYKSGSPNNPTPVNASKQPKGTVFGAPTPMKKSAKKAMTMSPAKKMAVKKKKVGNAAEKQMFGMK